jgi:tetratricopeptide (TPR) repeat protein
MELSSQGKYEEAINIIKPLKETLDTNDQNYILCLYFLSENSTKIYKPHDAIKYNEEIIKRNPEAEVDALAVIARNKTLLGNFYGSIAAYERILKLDPDYSVAYGNLANAYNYAGEYQKAIEILNAFPDSNNNYILHTKAFSYLNLGQNDSAKKYIDAYLLKDEANTDYMAYLDAAEIYNTLGNKKKSCEYITKSNEIIIKEKIQE